MTERLDPAAVFEAIDRMNPVLARLDLGGKLEEAAQAAARLEAARTKFEQAAVTAKLAGAQAEAFSLTERYGAASVDANLDALADATLEFGGYEQAMRAGRAANALVIGTHRDPGDSLGIIERVHEVSGLDLDRLPDKIAARNQASSLFGSSAGAQAALSLGLKPALDKGLLLDRYFALAAEAMNTTGGQGATRLAQGLREPGAGRANLVAELLQTRTAEIARIEKSVGASRGAAGALASRALQDRGLPLERERLVVEGFKAQLGLCALEVEGEFARVTTAIVGAATSFGLVRPGLVEGLGAIGEVIGKLGGKPGVATDAALAVKAFANAITAVKTATALGGAAEAPDLLGRIANCFAPAVVTGYQAMTTPPVPASEVTGLVVGPPFAGRLHAWSLFPPARGNVDRRTNIAIDHKPTINISIPAGSSKDEAVAIVMRALDANSSELAYKMKKTVDKENAREDRKRFS